MYKNATFNLVSTKSSNQPDGSPCTNHIVSYPIPIVLLYLSMLTGKFHDIYFRTETKSSWLKSVPVCRSCTEAQGAPRSRPRQRDRWPPSRCRHHQRWCRRPAEFLALKHESRIIGHSSNPVWGFSMMEQVRLCAVWPMENWLGSSLNQIQGWTTVRESYPRALEQGSLHHHQGVRKEVVKERRFSLRHVLSLLSSSSPSKHLSVQTELKMRLLRWTDKEGLI